MGEKDAGRVLGEGLGETPEPMELCHKIQNKIEGKKTC